MQCPKCQSALREGIKFCEDCGFRITLDCSSCGAEIVPGKKYCGSCGTPAIEQIDNRFTSPEIYTPQYLADRILTSKAAIEGERKFITVLFADLKGSMELLADQDPEDARSLLDAVLNFMMDAVHRYEGTVNQVMGDGIMALFGAPLALEDHAVRACYAANSMQESIQEYREEVRRSLGVDVQIRIGLNSGEVVVRAIGSDLRMDYSAIGETTHLAARMEQLASPGSIYLTPETFHLAEGFVQVQSLGLVPVRGLQEPVEVFELTGLAPEKTRFHTIAASGLTRFVERGVEFDILRGVIYRAGIGQGQVLAVMGEAGVGKSRLFWEFTRSNRTKEWLVIESGSVSYGKTTAYKTVIDLLKAYFAIEETDDHRRTLEKVTSKIRTLNDKMDFAIAPVLSLFEVPVQDNNWENLDPPQRRQRTFDAVKGLLLQEAKVQPLCMVLEDLHWIDSETQALLGSLVESLPGSRILLLVNYRPEYEHEWNNKAYYTGLRLTPLSSGGSEELLNAILGENETLASLKKLLVERTEGNPFYLEECINTLIENRVIAGNPGNYELMEEVSEIDMPLTVQAMLAARIDRLTPNEKRLLQIASVIGMHVPLPLLSAISEMAEEELQMCIASLQTAEFLYEVIYFPEQEFAFKHALTHEVAYESLLVSSRRALHAAAGHALEGLYRDRLEGVYDRLAHHYSKTAEPEKAVEYLRKLAEKSAVMYAHAEALNSLQEALVHADRLSLEERNYVIMDLVIHQAESLHFLGKRQDIVNLLLQYQDRLERLQDFLLSGRYYFWLGWAHTWLGNRLEAAQNLDRSLKEAGQSGDEAIIGRAHHALALEVRYSGRLDEAVAHSRKAVSYMERAEDHFWLSQALLGLSYSSISVGDFDSALKASTQLEALGEARDNRRAQANAAMLTGLCQATKGDWAIGVQALQQALELSPDEFETAWILACLGRAYLEAEDADRAIAVLEQAVELGDRVRSRQFQAWFRTLLGEAYLSDDRIEEAKERILEALEISRDTQYNLGMGLSKLALGHIVQTQGALEEAEGHFAEALGIFTTMGARFEIARTYLDLAILARSRGDQEAIASHLQEARSLFKDLKIPKYVNRVEQIAKDIGAH